MNGKLITKKANGKFKKIFKYLKNFGKNVEKNFAKIMVTSMIKIIKILDIMEDYCKLNRK